MNELTLDISGITPEEANGLSDKDIIMGLDYMVLYKANIFPYLVRGYTDPELCRYIALAISHNIDPEKIISHTNRSIRYITAVYRILLHGIEPEYGKNRGFSLYNFSDILSKTNINKIRTDWLTRTSPKYDNETNSNIIIINSKFNFLVDEEFIEKYLLDHEVSKCTMRMIENGCPVYISTIPTLLERCKHRTLLIDTIIDTTLLHGTGERTYYSVYQFIMKYPDMSIGPNFIAELDEWFAYNNNEPKIPPEKLTTNIMKIANTAQSIFGDGNMVFQLIDMGYPADMDTIMNLYPFMVEGYDLKEVGITPKMDSRQIYSIYTACKKNVPVSIFKSKNFDYEVIDFIVDMYLHGYSEEEIISHNNSYHELLSYYLKVKPEKYK